MTTPIIIRNATVLDPDSETLVPDQVIQTEAGRIVAVGGVDVEAASSPAQVLDARGLTVMPGLMDAHVHVASASGDLAAISSMSPFYVAAQASVTLKQMLRRGFTTVRDVAGADFGIARAVDENLLIGPRVLFGGPAFTQTGGHGDTRSEGQTAFNEGNFSLNRVVDGVEELRRAAREQLRKGAHHLKMYVSGGVAASPTDQMDATQYTDEEIRAVVAEAMAAHRYVAAHAYSAEAINRALTAGVRSIEHGNLIDESSVALFKQHRAFMVPTLATYYAMAREGAEHGVPANPRWPMEKVLGLASAALELAHYGGVDLAFGTDLLGGMQKFQSHEFALRADLQPAGDVVRAATTNAARLFRMEETVGKVEVGFAADLIFVKGNPLDDVRVLADPRTNIRLVMKSGQIFRNDLDS